MFKAQMRFVLSALVVMLGLASCKGKSRGPDTSAPALPATSKNDSPKPNPAPAPPAPPEPSKPDPAPAPTPVPPPPKPPFKPEKITLIRAGQKDGALVVLEDLRELDLNDVFAFDKVGAERAKAHLQCGRFEKQREFTRKSSLSISKLVPDDLYTSDFEKSDITCALELTLNTAEGEAHTLRARLVRLRDTQAPFISVGDNGAGNKFTVGDLSRVRLRAPGRSGQAHLYCEDAQFEPLAMNQTLELEAFDLSRPRTKPDRPARAEALRRVQSCRTVVFEDDKPAALSPMFQLVFPRRAFRMDDVPQDAALGLRQFDTEQPVAVRRVKLHNPEPFARTFRVLRRWHPVRGDFYIKSDFGRYHAAHSVSDYVQVRLETAAQASVGGELFEVRIEAGATIDVSLMFIHNNRVQCNSSEWDFEAVVLTLTAPIEITEVDENKNFVAKYDLAQGAVRVLNAAPLNPALYQNDNRCRWR